MFSSLGLAPCPSHADLEAPAVWSVWAQPQGSQLGPLSPRDQIPFLKSAGIMTLWWHLKETALRCLRAPP